MTFDDIKRVFPKCPAKSIIQIGGEDWRHKMGGYGLTAYSPGPIAGKWNCIAMPEGTATDEHVNCLKPEGVLICHKSAITSKEVRMIYNEEFIVYLKK